MRLRSRHEGSGDEMHWLMSPNCLLRLRWLRTADGPGSWFPRTASPLRCCTGRQRAASTVIESPARLLLASRIARARCPQGGGSRERRQSDLRAPYGERNSGRGWAVGGRRKMADGREQTAGGAHLQALPRRASSPPALHRQDQRMAPPTYPQGKSARELSARRHVQQRATHHHACRVRSCGVRVCPASRAH